MGGKRQSAHYDNIAALERTMVHAPHLGIRRGDRPASGYVSLDQATRRDLSDAHRSARANRAEFLRAEYAAGWICHRCEATNFPRHYECQICGATR